MAPTIDQVIAVAASQVGGYYPGSSKYGRWYDDKLNTKGFASAAFCAMGLSWAFDQVGGLDIFPLHAYTPSGVNWFKQQGRWHNGISGIRRGDIGFADFPGAPNRVSHTFIVESVNSDGSFNTIEFNTSGTASGDQRNGRVVARKRRKSYIVGYGRPAYANAPSTPPPAQAADNLGYSNGYIKARQIELRDLGYYKGAIDGYRGPQMIAATKAFQRDKGLTQDGIPGPKTRAALNSAIHKPHRPNIKPLQAAVRAAQDNSWGPDTDKRFNALREASRWGGYDFPYGVKFAQNVVGTAPDGDWARKSIAAHDATVYAVQKALKAMGYDPGPLDKSWGPSTEAAFQSARRAARS